MPYLRSLSVLLVAGLTATADPLSTSRSIDFFREVSSRNLHGLAARSDGRLTSGADVHSLTLVNDADLLWSGVRIEDILYVGSGPDGRILAIQADAAGTYHSTVAAELSDAHVLALAALPDGSLLAGTSPAGALALVRNGEVVARAELPVGSVLEISFGSLKGQPDVLVATGDPGRIYRVDLKKFEAAGLVPEKLTTADALQARGITLFGQIRDDNVRSLLRRPDGTVIAGSAPKGNIYAFAPGNPSPEVLAENRASEVTALLDWEGGFFAALTTAADNREARVKRGTENGIKKNGKENNGDEEKDGQKETVTLTPAAPAPVAEKFRGRGQLLWFPDGGFPETVATRLNTAFYQLQREGDLVLITGGEEGELLGYDPARMRSLTFAGATAAQVNAIVPAGDGDFFLIGNNPGGVERMRFSHTNPLAAESNRIDLTVPSEIGALRFEPSVGGESAIAVDLRASSSSDELEGWGSWHPAVAQDGAWTVPGLRGRYVQIRVKAKFGPLEISAATLYTLPQNRRPQLQNFRVLSPNFALIPAVDRPERPGTSLGQILQSGSGGSRRDNFLNSEIVPQPGSQVVFWDVNDQNGDNLVSTFSIRGPGAKAWSDLVIDTTELYAQFEISHLPEGVYRTRLAVRETAPRPEAQRLSAEFETDDFVIDRSAPEITAAAVSRVGAGLRITVTGHDALSLLRGCEFNLNNGSSFDVEQPADGILDGRSETFVLELTGPQLGGSTSVEVVLFDQAGNTAARRLAMP